MKSFGRASFGFSGGIALMLLTGVTGAGVVAQPNSSVVPAGEVVLEKELHGCSPEPCVIDTISGEPASWAFYDLLLTLGVPGGIAELPNSEEKFGYTFNVQGRKVVDFLKSLTTAEPRYQWTQTDGVLNLVPVQEPVLLRTPISEFAAQDANVWELIEALKKNPDFQDSCKNLNFVERSPENFFFGRFRKPVPPALRFSFRLRHLTVRQILNEIVKRDGIWHYHEFSRRDGTLGFDLYIGDYSSAPAGKHDQN
jgi:hypothetical protein